MQHWSISLYILMVLISYQNVVSQKINIMTFNIRYDEPSDSLDNWHLRKMEMADFIMGKKPLVLGIQEGLHHQVIYLDSALVNYSYVGCGRDDGQQKGEYTAIYIDTSVFTIKHSGTFWLSETPEKVSVGWDAALPRICTYALISHKKLSKSVWVFNSHFDHKGELSRLKAAELIIKKSTELNVDNLPYIIMGDLNATPEEKPMVYLYSHHPGKPNKIKGPSGTFNGFGRENNSRHIDFVFTKDIKVLSYHHLKAKRKNGRYISDHLPVMAKVKF